MPSVVVGASAASASTTSDMMVSKLEGFMVLQTTVVFLAAKDKDTVLVQCRRWKMEDMILLFQYADCPLYPPSASKIQY